MKKLIIFLSVMMVSNILVSASKKPTVTSTTHSIVGSIASYAYHNPIKTTATVLVLTDIAIRGLDNSVVSRITDCVTECGQQIFEDGQIVHSKASDIAQAVVKTTASAANSVSSLVGSIVHKLS